MMIAFTDKELGRVFSWLPYRLDWPVDRNQKDDNIQTYFGNLIDGLTRRTDFDSHYSEDGGMGNYLEFVCYPSGFDEYKGSALLVCVSLCAPIAAYGEVRVEKARDFIGWSGMFDPTKTGCILDDELRQIELIVRDTLEKNGFLLIDAEFASRPLPDKVAESLQHENHNFGDQYLHGLFQKAD